MSKVREEQEVTAGSDALAVSPVKFFETMHAYQRTAALKAAIELELFTAVGETTGSLSEISQRIKAPERGVRALCDFMVISGFLNKDLEESRLRYSLTPDSAAFLHKKSPAYVGCATVFLASPFATEAFRDLASLVRAGGPPPTDKRIDTENPAWVDFARGMAPVMYPVAEQTEKLVRTSSEIRVLDVAAGHGLFGIAIARQNARAQVVALDWPSVLTVTKENAEHFDVYDRYLLLAGNALEVPFGEGFDVVLAANLLHHWDRETIQVFLRKAHGALAANGRIIVVEFAPNNDRVSPPLPASFVMNMFANTPGGDAYTVSEHVDMLRNAGFSSCEVHPLLPTPQTAIVATKS
jgi:2-polyprenyl-3-methyl-5-hydroxy-6-metoxy-1,4-benzoquinol methylase